MSKGSPFDEKKSLLGIKGLTRLSLCSGVIIAVNLQENRVSISLKQSRLPEEHKHLRLVNVHLCCFYIVASQKTVPRKISVLIG